MGRSSSWLCDSARASYHYDLVSSKALIGADLGGAHRTRVLPFIDTLSYDFLLGFRTQALNVSTTNKFRFKKTEQTTVA